ncbi:hypothetical protein KY366_04720 [Candidatus Woesearchaeota archaeon]|nr:hypothetical protein [Candidatus Woesearchaeota archaeon]
MEEYATFKLNGSLLFVRKTEWDIENRGNEGTKIEYGSLQRKKKRRPFDLYESKGIISCQDASTIKGLEQYLRSKRLITLEEFKEIPSETNGVYRFSTGVAPDKSIIEMHEGIDKKVKEMDENEEPLEYKYNIEGYRTIQGSYMGLKGSLEGPIKDIFIIGKLVNNNPQGIEIIKGYINIPDLVELYF